MRLRRWSAMAAYRNERERCGRERRHFPFARKWNSSVPKPRTTTWPKPRPGSVGTKMVAPNANMCWMPGGHLQRAQCTGHRKDGIGRVRGRPWWARSWDRSRKPRIFAGIGRRPIMARSPLLPGFAAAKGPSAPQTARRSRIEAPLSLKWAKPGTSRNFSRAFSSLRAFPQVTSAHFSAFRSERLQKCPNTLPRPT